MKTRCPHCDSSIIVEDNETVYDERRYSGQCPSCRGYVIAAASVVITYELVTAEVDADGPVECCDESVDIRTDHNTNRERMRAAIDLVRSHGAELDPKWISEYESRFGMISKGTKES